MQQVQQLALVFVDALDLHVKERRGVDDLAGGGLHASGQLPVGVLDGRQRLAQPRVAGLGRELAQGHGVMPPALAR